jgi:DNA-binding FadR family transcriptional regulator
MVKLCVTVILQGELVNQSMEDAAILRFESGDTEDTVVALRAFISDGGYGPGDRLPSERDLIVRLGITRSALRKAFDALEREGSIWRHVGKGTFIASQGLQDGDGLLADLIEHVTPVTLMRARLSLEPAIAREAAINASEASVARVRDARDRTENAATWAEYEANDDLFHRALAQASENILLLSLFDHLNAVRRAVAWNTVIRTSARPAGNHTSFAEHRQIVEAIESRDPSAAQTAMRTHLKSVADRLFGEF